MSVVEPTSPDEFEPVAPRLSLMWSWSSDVRGSCMVWYVFDDDGWTCQRSEDGLQRKETLAPDPGRDAFQQGFAQAVKEWASSIGPMYLTVPEGGLGGVFHKYNVQRPEAPPVLRKRHPLFFRRRKAAAPSPPCYGIFTEATSRCPARRIETAQDPRAVLARLLELAESPRQELAQTHVSF